MREQVTLFLDISRDATSTGHCIPTWMIDILLKRLGITDAEFRELVAIRMADVREAYATTPVYGKVNDQLKFMDFLMTLLEEGKS